MDRKDIYARLCFYDRRNPNGIYSYGEPDADDLPQHGLPCACENCFYGRTELADALLDAMDAIERLEWEAGQ